MKIHPIPLTPNHNNEKTSLRSTNTQGHQPTAGSTTANASGSPVQLSPAARALQQLQNDHDDIHTQRVHALKDALQSGELQINPTAIADGLLESARDLLK
ncbi:MAG TPA: flagellar biosynthesis anti-sigma factor FlgM [Paenalcaligenes sp.]|nr:flagellar biosynthesis anti-sigma factor FlgM [Paenalcaligenes sp.]